MSFADEERTIERSESHRRIVTWGLAFVLLFAFVFLAFWWSGSAVRYGAGRVNSAMGATYRVSGIILDRSTHRPIPWAQVQTDFAAGQQFFSTTADQNGSFSLMTLPERQQLQVSANGYRTGLVAAGRQWFAWLPRGSEQRSIELSPEPSQ